MKTFKCAVFAFMCITLSLSFVVMLFEALEWFMSLLERIFGEGAGAIGAALLILTVISLLVGIVMRENGWMPKDFKDE